MVCDLHNQAGWPEDNATTALDVLATWHDASPANWVTLCH